MTTDKGFFITIEGIEGCGKTTQIELLKVYIESRGYKVILTREPGGTLLGNRLRDILLHAIDEQIEVETELLLIIASRIEHVKKVIKPSMEQGKVIICDRFMDATVAYQGYGRGLDLNLINRFNSFAVGDAVPDITILMDIDESIGLKRADDRYKKLKNKAKDRFEREQIEFHKRVRHGYQEIAKSDPERVKLIYADGSIEEVHKKLRDLFDKLIYTSKV